MSRQVALFESRVAVIYETVLGVTRPNTAKYRMKIGDVIEHSVKHETYESRYLIYRQCDGFRIEKNGLFFLFLSLDGYPYEEIIISLT